MCMAVCSLGQPFDLTRIIFELHSLYQQLQFWVHHWQIGIVYSLQWSKLFIFTGYVTQFSVFNVFFFLVLVDQMKILSIWSLFQHMEQLLEDGLELGLCRLTGKGHGRYYFTIPKSYIQTISSCSWHGGLVCVCVYLTLLIILKQEWPICVCYGAIGGYIVGQIVSLCFMLLLGKDKNLKVA